MKKDMYFCIAALAFLNMATLTKHRILRYESYFFIFCVFVFFLKSPRTNDSKIQGATFIQTITKDWSPGTQFGTKNSLEFTSKRPTDPKIIEKSSFCPCRFWNIFIDTKNPISFGFLASKWGGETGWTSPDPENRCLRSGTIWRDLATILGIIRARQLPLPSDSQSP